MASRFVLFSAAVLCVVVGFAHCLTPAERAQVVTVHNQHRQQLAHGQIPNKSGNTPAKLPTGKNIYRLRYDLAAEKLAQTAVNTCSGSSAGAKLNYRMGGNVAASTLIANAVSVWAGMLQSYGVGADLKFTKNNPMLYYWAELTYAVNYKVGCATKYCAAQGFTWIVCQYQPKEIPYNTAVYTPGAPCKTNAQCTTYKNSKCEVATGLCLAP